MSGCGSDGRQRGELVLRRDPCSGIQGTPAPLLAIHASPTSPSPRHHPSPCRRAQGLRRRDTATHSAAPAREKTLPPPQSWLADTGNPPAPDPQLSCSQRGCRRGARGRWPWARRRRLPDQGDTGRWQEVAGLVLKMLCGTNVLTHIRWGRRRGLGLAGGRVRAVAGCGQGWRLRP